MTGENTQRRWVVRGFQFNIIERKHWLPSGEISVFSCESLDGLVHDELLELSVEATVEAIDDALPEWIERARANGREDLVYDPAAAVEELPPADESHTGTDG